jgi:hypothetical protein
MATFSREIMISIFSLHILTQSDLKEVIRVETSASAHLKLMGATKM